MRPKTVARRLLLPLVPSFALILGLGAWLLDRFEQFPEDAASLTSNLEATFALNQRIHRDVQRTLDLVHRQLEAVDPAFPEEFRRLNHAIGEMETRYLRLAIDQEERLSVERIRATFDELGIRAGQIYGHLLAGDRVRALDYLAELQRCQAELDEEFVLLGELQVAKLDAVVERLRGSVRAGRYALLGLGAGALLVLALFLHELRHLVLDPIRSILYAAERLRGGDHAARAPVERADELGRLATGFNFMADSLVRDQQDLERRVVERTRRIEELQQNLIQSAKLSALGELVGGVAHELNNPLTAIRGYAELSRTRLQRSGADSGLVESLLEAQQVIVSQVERCKRIVTGLSQFARPQTPRLETVRLNRLVEGVLALREYELASRNVALVRDYDPADPELAADPYKLEQVVLNLLNNAHDAIREAGRGAGTIRVVTAREGESVQLSVEDDGTGIAAPDRIFEPFYTTKEVGQGTGLGLSVCYGIVEEHGGTIRAENLERGARLTVNLPVRPAAAAGGREEPPAPRFPIPGSARQAGGSR